MRSTRLPVRLYLPTIMVDVSEFQVNQNLFTSVRQYDFLCNKIYRLEPSYNRGHILYPFTYGDPLW